MDRREFLRFSINLGTFWALESLPSFCPHSQAKPGAHPSPGPYNNGLKKAGREVTQRKQEVGMIVDVAQAPPQTLKQIVEMYPNPLLDLHTNLCPGENSKQCGRLRTWNDMELIAKTGRVICTWPWALSRQNYKHQTFLDRVQEILTIKKPLGIVLPMLV